jgi:hypothetical protein
VLNNWRQPARLCQYSDYALDDRRIELGSRQEQTCFSSSQSPAQVWGPRSLVLNGYRVFSSPGMKKKGREADSSSQSSAEIKRLWSYTSTPPYVIMVWCLIKERGRALLLISEELKGKIFYFRRLCNTPSPLFVSFSTIHLLSATKEHGRLSEIINAEFRRCSSNFLGNSRFLYPRFSICMKVSEPRHLVFCVTVNLYTHCGPRTVQFVEICF